ncbi:MAG: DUF4783 domain-containing protein [Bacteroidetes bacterium]|nr:DUF4783 domain-containing protein [Bacteroidota bacterium]
MVLIKSIVCTFGIVIGVQLYNAHRGEQSTQPTPQVLFSVVQYAFEQRHSAHLTIYFAPILRVAILSTETVVSQNQAEVLLSHFLATHRIISFSYITMHVQLPQPYALAKLSWIEKGTKRTATLFVVLDQDNSRWSIVQLCIYE